MSQTHRSIELLNYLSLRTLPALSLAVAVCLLLPATAVWYGVRVMADTAVMSETKELYFAQMADGGGFITEIILANPGETELGATLELFKSDGSPLTVTFNGATNNSFNWVIQGRSSLFLKTSGTGGQVATGWARVRSSGPLGGSLIYSYRTEDKVVSEAGLDPSAPIKEFCFTIDMRQGSNAGLAVANPNSSPLEMRYALYDANGSLKGQANQTLEAMNHAAKMIEDLFPNQDLKEFAGTVTAYSTGGPVVATTLRFDAVMDTLASVPVMSGLTIASIPTTTLAPTTTLMPSTTLIPPTTIIFSTTTTTGSGSTSTSGSTTTSTLLPGTTAGSLYARDGVLGNLRYVLAGTFTQGSPPSEGCRDSNEGPQFTHTLTKNLAVMETEVTRNMWNSLWYAQPRDLPADPSNTSNSSGPTDPVQSVTWYETVLFANLLSLKQGFHPVYYTDAAFTTPITSSNYQSDDIYVNWIANGYRLPTEGEWEYFTRAGASEPFSINEAAYNPGNCISCKIGLLSMLENIAWFCANADGKTYPAGTKTANPWGLKDVHGNVAEWVWDWDWFGDDYPTQAQIDYHG